MPTLLQDVRYALRTLKNSPGFTAAALLTLAIGIGANTAIFSLIDSVLLRPLPYKEPDRLAMLWTDDPKHDLHEEGSSYLNFQDWRNQNHSFSDMAVCTRGNEVVLTGAAEPERIQSEAVSANLFDLLGTPPILGRTFSQADVENRESVVLLSFSFWQSHFGSSRNVIGKSIEINGRATQVVGVMPSGFFFPTKEAQLWEPVTSFSRWDRIKGNRFNDWWRVVGRLNPNTSIAQAQAEMNVIGGRLEKQFPTTDAEFAGFGARVVPIGKQIVSTRLRLALWTLLGAVFFVLLIACANLANLILARGGGRTREFAVRAAVGASRARLICQMLTESAALSFGGGLMALLIGAGMINLLKAFAPSDIPRLDEVCIDVKVLAFTFFLSLIASLSSGLLPALRMSQAQLIGSLKEGGRSLSGTLAQKRTRSLLVVLEVASAVVLLAGAGLMLRSLRQIQEVRAGLNSERVLTMTLNLPTPTLDSQVWPSYQEILGRIAGLPGVESVGAGSHIFIQRNADVAVSIEGNASQEAAAEQLASDEVTPDFFKTLEIPLIKGRFFSAQDDPNSPRVAIINETMARHFFPGAEPLGKRFKFGGPDSKSQPWTIVGVVGDVRNQGLDKSVISQAFIPLSQERDQSVSLVIRTAADPLSFMPSVRERIRSVNKLATLTDISSLKQRLEEFTSQRNFHTRVLELFSILALALAAVGVYGVMSYTITQRTHEIGIRMALGAQRRDILTLVLWQGMAMVLVGVALGTMAALWLTPVLQSVLFGISATDPFTFASVALLLIAVALIACYLPAWKATGIDPLTALHSD